MSNPSTQAHPIIISDLDGTLLDKETYSHQEARTALRAARLRRVPIVICSSKTRAEQLVVRRELGIRDPFIVEDGGAVLVEEDYFKAEFPFLRKIDKLRLIELGTPYESIRDTIEHVRAETGIQVRGYGDMAVAEVAEATGLDREAAALAMKREYQETLVSSHPPNEVETLGEKFAKHGLQLTRGSRFLAVSGHHDKGMAIKLLGAMYRSDFSEVETVGIGDSHNDLSMFLAVDLPVLVQKSPNTWEAIQAQNLLRVDGVGPEGWNRFVLEYLTDHKASVNKRGA